MAMLGDVLGDRLHLLGLVAQTGQGARDGLVDDLHGTAADELLELHQRQVGLDTSGVTVHHEADGAGRRQQAGLRVPVPICLAKGEAFLPSGNRRGVDVAVHAAEGLDLAAGVGVLAHDALVRRGVALIPVVGPDGCR